MLHCVEELNDKTEPARSACAKVCEQLLSRICLAAVTTVSQEAPILQSTISFWIVGQSIENVRGRRPFRRA